MKKTALLIAIGGLSAAQLLTAVMLGKKSRENKKLNSDVERYRLLYKHTYEEMHKYAESLTTCSNCISYVPKLHFCSYHRQTRNPTDYCNVGSKFPANGRTEEIEK